MNLCLSYLLKKRRVYMVSLIAVYCYLVSLSRVGECFERAVTHYGFPSPSPSPLDEAKSVI